MEPPQARETAAPAIEVYGVTKWFDGDGGPLTALQDIELAVKPRSILAILGASGCGKSTLLNIISGILRPSRGYVTFGGIPSDQYSDWRSIGYVFQDDRLLPWRTALHNVEFALEAGAAPRARRTGAKRPPAGRPRRFRRRVPLPAFGRHAEPRRARARPGHGADHTAHGRALLAARRANARAHAFGAAAHLRDEAEILRASGTAKKAPPDSAFLAEPYNRSKKMK